MLRLPLHEKPRRLLRKALDSMNRGNHAAAIPQLEEVAAKYPDAAYYAQSLLGIAYLQTDRYASAVTSLQKAVQIVPHDAVNHYNLALSRALAGSPDEGEQEARRALQLDPTNSTGQALLAALQQRKK